ncbi:hypothetical protein [Sinomicrobium soli]|uniref:hypothetical protein n=1 Tax=Sinomicrobium sp. N-1-3-6 TaxID=2219864 RepID=UPI000DCE4EB6|nr:hypothetical protein [Sinomicrobium sp. N-1-3-6]RAV30049.1 hypothetical protein DN748_04415 [Sinomicrobium sp. N-1-3-6]
MHIGKYLRFLLRSTNQYGVHSPFIYGFVTGGLYKRGKFRGKKTHRILFRMIKYFRIGEVILTGESRELQTLLHTCFPGLADRAKGEKRLVYHRITAETDPETLFSREDFGAEDILVLDGIYESRGTEDAWNSICGHPRARVTVDLFWLGVVFFRTGQAREHFVIRP